MWLWKIEEFNQCDVLTEKSKSSIIQFMQDNDMQALPNGRYDLGDENYVNIFEYDTKENDGVFEAHKQYIDIHYAILGSEKILWADKMAKEIKPYQKEGDYSLGTVENPMGVTASGFLTVFLPDTPHKAGICIEETVRVKKAVFKFLM